MSVAQPDETEALLADDDVLEAPPVAAAAAAVAPAAPVATAPAVAPVQTQVASVEEATVPKKKVAIKRDNPVPVEAAAATVPVTRYKGREGI